MLTNDLILLKLIRTNGNLSSLTQLNLSYSQIAMMIDKQIESGYVVMNDQGYQLTESGDRYLNYQLEKASHNKAGSWILPQKNHYRKPISIKEVILPRKL